MTVTRKFVARKNERALPQHSVPTATTRSALAIEPQGHMHGELTLPAAHASMLNRTCASANSMYRTMQIANKAHD